jgi:hypothetical protein
MIILWKRQKEPRADLSGILTGKTGQSIRMTANERERHAKMGRKITIGSIEGEKMIKNTDIGRKYRPPRI